ncbi:MAG: PD-(D/E)XK nuclease family protein, partial [Oscillospiraceae bacterium]|nr:PD-(D/E)XK nuclease family protein [Oscillospiraceae bacterium]
MRPTFLWSPDHRAGTDELLSRLLADAANGLDCVWLVPEPYSHSAERLLAERGGAPVCLRAEVITFRRLVDRVLAEAGGLARPVLDVGGRLLMLRRAVGAASGELTVLRRSAQKPAFLPDLLNTLDECKCYRITPQDLVRAADNAPPGVSDKLRDLGKLYAAYEEERGQLDPRDRVTLALEGAKTLKSFPILYVSDFASFTPQERLLLTGLSDKSPGLTVFFRGFFEGELSEPLRITAKQLAAHYPQGVTHTPLPPSDTETALLPVVSPNPQLPAAHCPLSMELHSASCEASEVRFAAERILRLVREEGYRYRDIVVLTGDFESYAPLFESIFPLYGIPVFQDRMDTPKPLPRCIRAVGDCLRYGYRGDDVMRLLRSGLLPVPPADADLLENYLRRWNPRGSRFSGGRDWDRSPEGYGEPDERAREELIRLNALRRFLSSGMKRFQGDTAQKCAEGLYLALEALGVPEGLEIHRNALLAAGELKLANEVSQMWEIFVHTLEQCVLVLGDSPSDPSEFCNLCLTVLSGYSVGSIPASLDRVHVGDQGRMARIPVPAVLFLGADRVPASNAPGGLLSEEERKALSDAGCETPPDPPARIGRERLNLFTALTLPTRSLILTYPAAGAADPSPEWFGRLSALAGTPVTPVPPPTPPAAPAPLTFDAPLSGRNAAALYGQTLTLTASRLESFSLCPFHHFVRYGLSARPRPEPGFPPPDVGKELHLILAKCTRYASERGGFPNI